MDHYKDGFLPPLPVLLSIIDTYFEHFGNQDFSFLREGFLRANLEADTLPKHLLLAVLAAAVPLSSESYYRERRLEAAETYANESWQLVSAEARSNPDISTIRTLLLTGRRDIHAGRAAASFEKADLTIKVARTLQLMAEPPSHLPFEEQEERRRIAWIIYATDRIHVGSKLRPFPALEEEECLVNLPTQDEVFRAGEWQEMGTISDLLADESQSDLLSHSGCLAVLMLALTGRCMKYVHRDGPRDRHPPWNSDSVFTSITALLDRTKGRFTLASSSEIETYRKGIAFTQAEAGLALWARIQHHLSHCIITHPLFMQKILKPFGRGVETANFTMQCFESAIENSRQMVDLIDAQYKAAGFSSETNAYTYWTVITGSILSLAHHSILSRDTERFPNSLQYFEKSLKNLKRLAQLWPAVSRMRENLLGFHNHHSRTFAATLDPDHTPGDADSESTAEQALADLLDHEQVLKRIPALVGSAEPSAGSSDTSSSVEAWAGPWERDPRQHPNSGSPGSSTGSSTIRRNR